MTGYEQLKQIRGDVAERSPLIHFLTNHITINDCANIVLAVGGKPIMAEHPAEVEEITGAACALAMNLGNITDDRMESMRRSARAADRHGLPSILDIVGVACSALRLNFARELLKSNHISVIKGNMSEMKALYGVASHPAGIDAGAADALTPDRLPAGLHIARRLSELHEAAVVATGEVDIIADKDRAWAIENGCPRLAQVTGTGCMVNALIGTYLAAGPPAAACILGVSMMGIGGELAAARTGGIGSFKTALFDEISTMTDHALERMMKLKKY